MMRILPVLILALFAVGGTALAQGNAIKARQELMKKNGEASKLGLQMIKGEKPYDAAAAAEAMNSIATSMTEFVKLFPEGTTGKDTDAKPEIWQNKADFDSWATKLKQDGAKAATAAKSGVDGFKGAFAVVGQSCQGCHEKYRIDR
jgi:cytochrome c556